MVYLNKGANDMPSITVPAEFFKKERNTIYSGWRGAFWRELFQNSVDAGCDNINITMDDNGSFIKVTFEDDGCGMSREVLDDVYFSLGKSSKDASTSTGGFGRARILTCFSMEYYKLWSHDYMVTGKGAEYSVRKQRKSIVGCKLEIGVDESTENDMMVALSSYLKRSNLPCTVTINGEKNKDSVNKGKFIRNLIVDGTIFADVYADDNSSISNRINVRVNGTMMFDKYISNNSYVVVELDVNNSREILTASRDNLHGKYNAELDRFINELNVNTNSSTRPVRDKIKTLVEAGGMIISERLFGSNRHGTDAKSSDRISIDVHEINAIGNHSTERNIIDENVAAFRKPDWGTEDVVEKDIDKFYPIPSVVTYIDSTNENTIKSAEKWKPVNWEWYMDGGTVRWEKGGKEFRVLQAWKICCEHAVECLLNSDKISGGVSWSIGWYFDDFGTQAASDEHEAGTFLLIRPTDDFGKTKFKTSDRASMKEMMAIAKHEVAHIKEGFHNESFSTAHTMIDILYDEWSVYKKITEIKA